MGGPGSGPRPGQRNRAGTGRLASLNKTGFSSTRAERNRNYVQHKHLTSPPKYGGLKRSLGRKATVKGIKKQDIITKKLDREMRNATLSMPLKSKLSLRNAMRRK